MSAYTAVPTAPTPVLPRLRGWLHVGSFFASLVTGAVLIPLAAAQGAALPISIYCVTVTLLFGVSALYHRRLWSVRGRQVMMRLDHSMIFVFIAGSYTPFAVLALEPGSDVVILVTAWTGALLGVALKLAWPGSPRWIGAPLYIALGWVAVFVFQQIVANAGVAAMVLMLVGGVLYTVGGIVYAARWPNPWPRVFGHHEVFHACTIVAAICHYIAVYFALYNT